MIIQVARTLVFKLDYPGSLFSILEQLTQPHLYHSPLQSPLGISHLFQEGYIYALAPYYIIMDNGKNLGIEHTFVLRLITQCGMDPVTIQQATFSTRNQIQRILDDLIEMNLVEKEWDGIRFLYKKR